MLGRPIAKKCFIVSFNNNDARNKLNKSLKKYQSPGEKSFFKSDPFTDEELSRRSDHYPFSEKIKNAFTIMASSPRDVYYHSADDEYDTIDYDFY